MDLIGVVKNFEWGKLGLSSTVARLAAENNKALNVDSETPYAELWMGNHPSGPSLLKTTGHALETVLSEPLPFLFKVLSIRKALSIQVHPNKQEALRLHNERPDMYKDSNHKPELAIALTPFAALCGFRPQKEIYNICRQLPPMLELVGRENIELLKNEKSDSLCKCYTKLMNSRKADTARCIEDILENYMDVLAQYGLREYFIQLNNDFEHDVGVLSLFYLNLLNLNPGQAIFLPANEIHAYLSGDCIECMACSDNVIRGGLTPKYKDVTELVNCLKFEGSIGNTKLFPSEHLNKNVRLYMPPVTDFAVVQITISPQQTSFVYETPPFDSILLVLNGERTLRTKINYDMPIKPGSIVFIPSHAAPSIEFHAQKRHQLCGDFTAFIASYNYFLSR